MDTTKGALNGSTRNRTIGGIVLLIGVIALIAFFVIDSEFAAVAAGAGLFIGGMSFIMDGSGGNPGGAAQ